MESAGVEAPRNENFGRADPLCVVVDPCRDRGVVAILKILGDQLKRRFKKVRGFEDRGFGRGRGSGRDHRSARRRGGH